ncbi:hypothetical protein [Lentzea albida]|uniref:Uncharacterized protein n=1 Tax=Lentzea albida TaxID=65499 RepID=A0A1H9A9K0_9PSEU|nr:hypothetical protein [Lentzea albida]SEP73167.1 hypothetical protein SAMN04488000_10171 [Lentzea albida]
MNRSLAFVTIAAALGLAACTATPAPDTTPAPTSSTATSAPPHAVVTQVVTETVTKPVAPPAQPVIGSFGYGDLKLGLTLQQALGTKLLGPDISGETQGACTLHEITGTGGKVFVSKAKGVSSIFFTAAMASDGVGEGATEQKLKAGYTTLKAGPGTSYTAVADGNANAYFQFALADDKVTNAVLNLNGQDCHS